MRYFTLISAGLVAASLPVSAVTIAIFDENTIPANPVNGFGTFSYDDFSPAGAVTVGADSFTLNITDSNGSNGVFGGIGVDYVVDDGNGGFVPQDFDSTGAMITMRVRLLTNNSATGIRVAFADEDSPGMVDEHVFEFDLTSIPSDGEFHDISLDLNSPLFTQTAGGATAGDGVVNPGLRQLQIQSVFDSTGQLNVEIDFVEVTAIPEPSSALLGFLALGLLAGRRQR